ncbi:Ig-like domain-containing protein [Listeria grandensis]|uniref:Ig-like domain-containing protein n=1 Tax=Listeria grandensis TaxID=1494963 RepID=UPI00164D6236|nr:Ig-like domain-containing protein [Listeria grandensis]MBC6314435.1 hypothetical protein [Listeria grandensis]
MKKPVLLMMAGLIVTTGGVLGSAFNGPVVNAAENGLFVQKQNEISTQGQDFSKVLSQESVDVSLAPDKTIQITSGFHLGSTSISGNGVPGGGIRISFMGRPQETITVQVDGQGKWQAIIPKLELGHTLTLQNHGVGSAGSAVYSLWPSKLSESNIDPVTTNSTKITGSGGYPGVRVEAEFQIKVGNQMELMSTSAIVDKDGNFELPITKQAKGYFISISQKWNGVAFDGTNGLGNFHVQVAEGIAKPSAESVTNRSTKVIGKGKAGATVRVSVQDKQLGTATVDKNGNYEVVIPAQKLGVELLITQEQNKDVSEETKLVVEQEIPEVTSELKDGMTTISGTAAPGVDITVWTGSPTAVAHVKADAITGNWSATVPELVGGNAVQVRATVAPGQFKDSVRYGVNLMTPSNLRAIIIGDRVKVTGKGSAGASVSVKIDGILAGTATVDNQGEFEVLIMRQIEGEQLSVTQTKNGMSSVASEVEVTKGLDKPSSIGIVTADSTKVTGKGSPNATISIKANGREIGTGKVDTQGNFDVAIPKQAVGTKLTISQLEGEDESDSVTVTVISGQLAAPTITDYYLNATYIRGEVPKGAVKVTLVIDGKFVKIGTISADGKYMIYANDIAALKVVGKTFEIIATDANGQLSAVAAGEVKGLSELVIAPYRAGQANITGTVKVGTERIAVYDNAGVLLRYGQVNADGTYRIYVSGIAALQTAGQSFTVRALNAAGVVSAQTTAVVLP